MKIKRIQEIRGYPWVSLPKEIFRKGDDVLVQELDDESVIITKRLPEAYNGSKRH